MTPVELSDRIQRTGIPRELANAIVLRLFNYWNIQTLAPTPDEWVGLAAAYGKPGEDVLIMDAVTL